MERGREAFYDLVDQFDTGSCKEDIETLKGMVLELRRINAGDIDVLIYPYVQDLYDETNILANKTLVSAKGFLDELEQKLAREGRILI